MTKLKAEKEGKSVFSLVVGYLLKTLAMTIPGFFIVLLFPIHADETYGWFGGIWQGWFGLCNMIIHLFSPSTLYSAPLCTSGYSICWWICFVWAVLCLPGFFMVFLTNQSREEHHFVNPNEQPSVGINEKYNAAKGDASVKTSIERRVIKVFISSTFKDMQKERDYLMNTIFPELKRIAAKRNVTFVPIDLRWGITEEESKSGKVMELCLQEIDNAIPFFIGIIGERYGWCPPVEEFRKSRLLREKYPWVEQDIEQGLSVTEMEMQYGVLRRKERINAAFFTTGGTWDAPVGGRIAKLKRAIIKDGRYPIIDSFTPEEFGKKVKNMYLQFLEQYFPEVPSEETDRLSQALIAESHADIYIPVEENEEVIDAFLAQDERPALIIKGEQGVGKTALLSGCLYKNGKALERQTAYHFFNYQRKSIYSIIKQFEEKMSKENVKLLIVNRFDDYTENEQQSFFEWYTSLEHQPKLIITILDYYQQLSPIANISLSFDMEPLAESYRRQFITEYLKHFGKKLSETQTNVILTHPLCTNMLILKTILDELLLFGKFELLDHRIAELLDAKTPANFFQKVLERFEKQYGRKQIRAFFSAASLTYFGLKSEDLIGIADVDMKELEFSLSTALKDLKKIKFEYQHFEDNFQEYLVNRDGFISLAHTYMLKAVEERYLADDKAEKKLRKKIIEQLELHIGISKVTEKCNGRVEEVAYQYMMLGNKSDLEYFLESDVPRTYLKKNQPDLFNTLLEIATSEE